MKGNNEIRINQSTMVEAIQFWINAQMVIPPKVDLIEFVKDGYMEMFVIHTTSIEKIEEKVSP